MVGLVPVDGRPAGRSRGRALDFARLVFVRRRTVTRQTRLEASFRGLDAQSCWAVVKQANQEPRNHVGVGRSRVPRAL